MKGGGYIPLWVKSNFSFLEGASDPGELVEAAHACGLPALALTDRDGVYGAVRGFLRARELGLKLIVGSQVSVADGTRIVLLAADRTGYANLCRLLTAGRLRHEKGHCAVHWEEVCDHAPGLIALWGGEHGLLGHAAKDPAPVAGRLVDAFGDHLYAMAARHRRREEPAHEARLRQRAARWGLPVVAAVEVLYHDPARRPLQDVVTCIRHGVTLATAGRLTKPNDQHALPSPAAFARLFADDPAAVANTRAVAGRIGFDLGQLRYVYPGERLPDGRTAQGWLTELAFAGAHERFGARLPPGLDEQLRRELKLIGELDYAGYFLTMWEIVQFCRREDILCQGRGSAANSAVCYCLGVTAVDPTRIDLLFERFLSRERAEPPDIDLDIEHDRREEVIQWVYRRYGRGHAAMVCNVIRYRARSAIRDVGKALGLPSTALDRLAKGTGRYDGLDPELIREAGLDPDHPTQGHLLRLVRGILGFPRHLSIHPGGFLLGHEPVATLVPVENASMPDRTVIQWDKDDIEALGLFKVDLLGLGALNHLHRAFDLLREHRRIELGLADIPAGDRATYEQIGRSDTVGVFQIESRAQMAMLGRLKPQSYYDLVIQISIVRPGPITGGMVHPYLRRRHGEEPVTYPHPSLEPVLKKTLGIPLFQEQVIRLAMVAADYTPGEADGLRRDMAAWKKHGRMERHRRRLIERMTAKGIERGFAERVFEQIRGFGEYGFPESHAASFALIAYATAWLKCHHPEVFACALLNAMPMGFYSAATIVHDAQRHGVEVRPVDVTASGWESTLEDAGPGYGGRRLALRMGLGQVKGLGRAAGEALVAARTAAPFRDLSDLKRRAGLNREAMVALAEAGALGAFAPSRRLALWTVHALDPSPVERATGGRQQALPLTGGDLPPALSGLSRLDAITWDHRVSRHSPRGHPLAVLRPRLQARGLPDARTVGTLADGSRAAYAGIVICRQRPSTAGGVVFMTLEDETGFVNLVLWADVFARFGPLAKAESFLGATGKLQKADNVVHLVVEELWRPRLGTDRTGTAGGEPQPPPAESHDFR